MKPKNPTPLKAGNSPYSVKQSKLIQEIGQKEQVVIRIMEDQAKQAQAARGCLILIVGMGMLLIAGSIFIYLNK